MPLNKIYASKKGMPWYAAPVTALFVCCAIVIGVYFMNPKIFERFIVQPAFTRLTQESSNENENENENENVQSKNKEKR
jgi:hypothetical protein